jgi:hypothetical protein
MRIRACLGGLGIVVALTATGGCLEEPDGGYGNPGKGYSLIGDVNLTEAALRHTEFAALETLRGFAPALTTVGSPSLGGREQAVAELTGIEAGQAKAAISVGLPPDDAAVLYGTFEPGGIKKKLTARGYEEKSAWLMTGTLPAGTGTAGRLNAVYLTGDRIGYAGSAALLEQATKPDGPSLTRSAPHKAVADCLDTAPPSPAAAILHRLDTGVVGLAVDRADGPGALETLCFQGSGIAERLEKAVSAGESRSGRPWREFLTEPKVERLPGDMARLTARTSTPGVLFRALSQNDLPGGLTSR